MYSRKILFTACSITLLALTTYAQTTVKKGWDGVQEAINKGLPQSAIDNLEPMIQTALAEKQYAEAIKAIAYKISLQGQIQGNKPEEKITRMRAAIDASPEEMKPVMEAIQANWYWQYLQENRWRFAQRSQTEATPSDDFTTWDLTRLLAEVDKQFTVALAAEQTLKDTPISDYDALLEKGSMPDAYRPTLYDFLAHNALQFYSAGEQVAAKSQDTFELSADGPIFGSAVDFLDWQSARTDNSAPLLKAIRLYQELLTFHQNDADQTAFLDVDLLRLVLGKNYANGDEKSSRFKAGLQRFADQYSQHELSTQAIYRLALERQSEGDFVEAREIAQQGMLTFPKSVGADQCFNLVQQIQAPELTVTTERVWNDSKPVLDVHYRNVSKLYFRLVKIDVDAMLKSGQWQQNYYDGKKFTEIIKQQPALAWSVDLPATTDYQLRDEAVLAKFDVPPGAYHLISSHKADFSQSTNNMNLCEVWVSTLSVVTRGHNSDGYADGFVLDAKTGSPIDQADVQVWYPDYNKQTKGVLKQTLKTDKNGMFRFSSKDNQQFTFVAKVKDQILSTAPIYVQQYDRNTASELAKIFTDRSLYRPGQTISFKAIALAYDWDNNQYNTLANRDVVAVFRDVNGKELERQKHRSNAYGSFSGSFTAPKIGLMGSMSILIESLSSQANIRVEEYKRPKFRVTLDKPTEAPKLNESVTVSGLAMGYTGSAINDAKVQYRVVREVNYPAWYFYRCWWFSPVQGETQEIAHGQAKTDSAGKFSIDFTAKPDASIAKDAEPTFRYTVYADVTDSTGETRSAQVATSVGYTALKAEMTAPAWQTTTSSVEIAIRTTTLDGEGQTASGTVKVYALEAPEKVTRAPLENRFQNFRGSGSDKSQTPPPDLSNPNSWKLGKVIVTESFETLPSGVANVKVNLPTIGIYRAILETKDRFGKSVTAELPIQVIDPDASKLTIKIPNLFATTKDTVEPGEKFHALWGTGYDNARAYIEVESRGKILQSYWTDASKTQVAISQKVDESLRGGFTVRATMVRENRVYFNQTTVNVPWTNKELHLSWEHFVSKLEPAATETWTAIIKGPNAQLAAAEMVATLYDASLDAYQPNAWPKGFDVFRRDYSTTQSNFANNPVTLQNYLSNLYPSMRSVVITYRKFPNEILGNNPHDNRLYFGFAGGRGAARNRLSAADADNAPMSAARAMSFGDVSKDGLSEAKGEFAMSAPKARSDGPAQTGGEESDGQDVAPDLSKVSARKNLNETAFFYPQLLADEDGVIKLQFTMPEALTQWRFLGFAHDQTLRAGLLEGTTVTAKELMVQPNAPRFVREGDVIEFTAKISNQSPTVQSGTAQLTFNDARTNDSVDEKLDNKTLNQSFEIPAGQSASLSWRIDVPDDLGVLTYKTVASTGKLSDGEEGFLPVLSRRILVTESLPLPMRGQGTKDFEFERLINSGNSDSLKSQSLRVQMVSNPAWYAVMALPYLMEYPYECAEQTFNRLYANALASHIAKSDPKIERIFAQWRATPALDSPLEKNEDLKSVLIEETPWLNQAEDESQARRNVGILFDQNRLANEQAAAFEKLSRMQLDMGAWPWFPGGPPNDYMTLYITTGFGRLRHLGVDLDMTIAQKSLSRLDAWMTEIYERIKPEHRDVNNLSSTIALYLYGRSFFLNDQAVAAEHQTAFQYWQAQAKEYWLQLNNRQSQAHVAVALKRIGDRETAKAIMASLRERSVSDEELGMFWRDTELSWWWFRAPIETQAIMIEAFDEVLNDQASVESCKVWLLKQKQTQDWKTTKATADAVYALLLRGGDLVASDKLVQVSLGGVQIKPKNVEAGTGFYEERFTRGEIEPKQGEITVTKLDAGVAWGSVHWQYLEHMSKITPYAGTPLQLAKSIYIKRNTNAGPELSEVSGAVEVGDELVVRIVLRSDRDMEYLHLKDYRGSGTEPVNVLSRYKYQDGLAYYESTRDTASHFFIDYLPKGTYVFEYSTRVQLRGEYQTGIAEIQCMYAPEFNSHSQSKLLEVK